jgi:acyl-coenzyme A thioesterase PaaI-like protein
VGFMDEVGIEVDDAEEGRGRRITIVEAEVTQDDELVAHAIGTFTSAN